MVCGCVNYGSLPRQPPEVYDVAGTWVGWESNYHTLLFLELKPDCTGLVTLNFKYTFDLPIRHYECTWTLDMYTIKIVPKESNPSFVFEGNAGTKWLDIKQCGDTYERNYRLCREQEFVDAFNEIKNSINDNFMSVPSSFDTKKDWFKEIGNKPVENP